MSNRTSACPSSEQLAALAVGAIPPERAEQLVEHLELCDACQSTLATLGDTSDVFVSRLRGRVEPDPFVEEEDCDQMLQQIQGLSGSQAPWVLSGSASSSSPLSRELPTQLGDYELMERLPGGGMGAVYKAVHTKLDRPVVLKVLPPDRMQDPQAVARFRREMKAVGRLDHPNIVRATDAGEEAGVHYLVMELVDGITLSNLVSSCGPLPIADVCELIRQAALGLDYAHERALIHRDVKPSNLMLSAEGQVKILDFGLARLRDQLSPEELTGSGQVMGTLDYLAPEQASRGRTVDCRVDIYSLGCTFYKLLTGQAPFGDEQYDSPVKKIMAHAQAVVSPIDEHRPDAPRKLDVVLQRMLAKEPDDRFSSAKEVAEALAPFTSGANLPGLLKRARSLRGQRHSTVDSAGMSPRLTASEPLAPRRSRPKLRHYALGVAALLLLSLGVILASTLTQWANTLLLVLQDKGTLIVETDDPDVTVKLDNQGVTIRDLVGGQTYELKVGPNRVKMGEYTMNVDSLPAGLKFETNRFTVTRGGKTTVNVRLETPSTPVEPSGEPVDLLALIEPSRDTLERGVFRGHWTRSGNTLVSPTNGSPCLQIPYIPPEEYVLDLTVKRTQNAGAICIGIVVAGRQCVAELDGWDEHGRRSLLNFLDPQRPEREASHRGQVIPDDRVVSIKCTVRKTALRLECDGREVFDWQGELSTTPRGTLGDGRLLLLPADERVLFLQTWGTAYHIYQLQLIPVSGQGQPIQFVSHATHPAVAAAQRVLWHGGQVTISVNDTPPVNIDSVRRLPQSFSLESIDLRGKKSFTEEDLKCISGLRGLKELDLCNTPLTDTHLETLAELRRLEKLDLSLTQITDAGLTHLKRYPNIRHLYVAGTGISDDGVRDLAELTQLEELDLRGTKISDSGLQHLKGLAGLRRLELDYTRISDAGLEFLGTLSGLRFVSLINTKTSDVGLEHLGGLKAVEEISAFGTDVSGRGIHALQQTLPRCRVKSALGPPIDLLRHIDVVRDTRDGPNWSFQGDTLVTSLPEPDSESTVIVPYGLPEEYILEMDVLRASGDDAIRVGLVAGDSRFNVWFEHGKETVFVETHDENYAVLGQTMRHLSLFAPNQLSTIAVTVRKTGITVAQDGRLLIAWKGDTTTLSADGHDVLGMRCPGLTVWHHSRYHISRMEVTPISGEVVELYRPSENANEIQEGED